MCFFSWPYSYTSKSVNLSVVDWTSRQQHGVGIYFNSVVVSKFLSITIIIVISLFSYHTVSEVKKISLSFFSII